MKGVVSIIVALSLFGGSALLSENARQYRPSISEKILAQQEVLYLPGGKGLALISFGYRNMLSNALWFKTISYFGKHFGTDRDYRWLHHMCNLVSDLNPRVTHVYKFCSMMLAWEADSPEASHEILTRAIRAFPESWEFYYYRGILNYLFLSDEDRSREDLTKAAELPGASVVVRRLAAKKLAIQDPTTAIEFLQGMIERSENETERKALTKRLREAVYERDARTLERAIELYEQQAGVPIESLGQLVEKGFVSHLKDPFGGVYVINEKTGRVVSSKGKARIKNTERGSAAEVKKRWEAAGEAATGH